MAEHDQRFDSFAQWFDEGPSWLGRRGPNETAVCLDARNRPCVANADFMRARDQKTFPVRWLWPEDVAALAAAQASECCVPRRGEPSFVLLGRDPQAPDLVEKWADDREAASPGEGKPTMARAIAERMRAYRAQLSGASSGTGETVRRNDAPIRVEATLREAFLTADPNIPREITPLSWLRSMVDACDGPDAAGALGGDDPDAWFEMCREVRGLLDKATAVLAPSTCSADRPQRDGRVLDEGRAGQPARSVAGGMRAALRREVRNRRGCDG
jgi:hypothetical protein